jgi:hypothetical protein
MDGHEFVEQLIAENERVLGKLNEEPLVAAADAVQLPALLKMALKNEMEAAEIAAAWVPQTPELEAKILFAQHAGDEARHYELLDQRLRAMGVNVSGFHPLEPPSPVLEYLRTLSSTIERVAAALVTREAMGGRRNQQFLKYLNAVGATDLARLYRDVIIPDEDRHHAAGCVLLARLAVTPVAQERARRAAARLLEIGDNVRTAVMQRTGAPVVPGC